MKRLVDWLGRYWKALLAVLAAVAAGVGIMLAGRRRGSGELLEAVGELTEAKDEGEHEIEAARRKAADDYKAAEAAERRRRESDPRDLGDYLDERTGRR